MACRQKPLKSGWCIKVPRRGAAEAGTADPAKSSQPMQRGFEREKGRILWQLSN